METISADVFSTFLLALSFEPALAILLFLPPVLMGFALRPGLPAGLAGAISLKLCAVAISLSLYPSVWWANSLSFTPRFGYDFAFGAFLAVGVAWLVHRRVRQRLAVS